MSGRVVGRGRWLVWVAAALLTVAGLVTYAVVVPHDRLSADAATTPTVTQPPAAPPAGVPLTPAPGGTGRGLAEPRVYSSEDGELNVTLVASQRRVTIAGRRVLAKVYGDSFVAPTLVVKPGDMIRITLVNHLDEPTNLHFHGLEVSPSGHADNIFVSVNPGTSFRYAFRLPRSAPTGTFWYHSHEMVPMSQMTRYPNAYSEEQVFDGLSGLIEVQGLTNDLPAGLRHVVQRYLALRDVQVADGAIATGNINSNAPTTRLVDGQLQPRITIAPGQTELWHIANIGADIFYRLALSGHTFDVIAQDGHPVIHATPERTLLLPPGKRFDVLIRGGRVGATPLQTLYYNEGDDHYPRRTLATVVTTGRARRPQRAPGVISWGSVDLGYAHVVRRRVVVFS